MSATFTRLLTGLGVALATGVVSAAPIAMTDLFNTGVNSSGVALAGGVLDPHYTLISAPGSETYTVTTVASRPGAWLANTTSSAWIGISGTGTGTNSTGPAGTYIFQTSFFLPSNFLTASITGQWSTDNSRQAIFLNGVNVGFPDQGLATGQFGNYLNFSISSGFQAGLNTLQFHVFNFTGSGPNPMGLRVDNMSGTYTVPSPGGFGLAAIALAALVLVRAGRRQA